MKAKNKNIKNEYLTASMLWRAHTKRLLFTWQGKVFVRLLVFSVIIALAACHTKKEEVVAESTQIQGANTVQLTEAQFISSDIKLGKIEQRTLSGALKVNGRLDVPPQNMVSVSAPLGGFLHSTEMLQGMQVRKGESIAVIQNPDYIQLQQDYLDNKSQLEFLEAEFKRQQELAKENINAQKSLQQAKASYFSKLAIVKGLRSKLKMLNIDVASLERGEIGSTINLYAPINGFITEVNFNIGSFVNPTDVLFKIVDTSHLHAELTVFEKDAIKVKKGQKIRFTLAGAGKERSATVYLIGREISADRTVRIHGHLDHEDVDLLPGMYLCAVIELANNAVDALPENAIVEFEGRHYVFIAGEIESSKKPMQKENKSKGYTLVEVKTGLSELGYTEIILPDSLDETSVEVVVNGAYSLLSKMKNSEEE